MKFNSFYFNEDEWEDKVKSYKSAEDFVKSQYTGFISSDAYEDMRFDMDIKKVPNLIKTIETKSGEKIEFRKTGEKLKYTKIDKEGNIVRDSKGLAMMMSDDEIKERGLPIESTTIYAFNSKGEEVGYASDEFGADGVWVKPEYQKQGIGTELLHEFRKQFKNRPNRKIGQMTPAGMNMTRSYWRKLTGKEKPDINMILNKYKEFLKNYDDTDDSKDEDYDIKDSTPEYMKALIRFEYTISPDEKTELNQYFYPGDFKQEISPKDFYEKYKK